MTARRTRRTVRSAGLLAVAAAAAFSLTACGSDAGNDASGATKKESASASPSTGGAGEVRNEAATASHGSTAGKKSLVRNQKLPDGSTAKIYKLGSQHYSAKIVSRGDVLATMEAKDKDDALDANDMFLLLSIDGQLQAWMGGGQPGPGTVALEGGWKAKVHKIDDGHYRAEILGREGSVDARLEANQKDAGVNANGVYIVLSSRGVISAHS